MAPLANEALPGFKTSWECSQHSITYSRLFFANRLSVL
jgi:hypothetical protein